MGWREAVPSEIGHLARPWDIWHEIVDEVFLPDEVYPDGERRLLLACRHWNSETWVRRDGRDLTDAVPGGLAPHCDTTTMGPPSQWELWRTPADGPVDTLYLRTAGVWHLGKSTGIQVSRERNAVYLTTCGYWTTDRTISKVVRAPNGPGRICSNCSEGGEER